MIRRLLCLVFTALLCGSLMSGCIYSRVKVPFDEDVSETELGDKIGKASLQSVLWLFAWGDASTAKAAENGGLSKINHLDQENELYLFGLITAK